MEAATGYYSIIQYCPDPSRLEAANVGVLVFCPDRGFIKAAVARGNDRIRRFFRSEDNDWDQINAMKTSIVERLEVEKDRFHSLEDLQQFIASRANEVRISPPRTMRVADPEQDLQDLFEELVGGRKQTSERAQTVRHDARYVHATIDTAFRREAINHRVKRDVEVYVPVFRRTEVIPYGFQNGRFNLVRPESFDLAEERDIIDRACSLAVEGRSLHSSRDSKLGDLQLSVVGWFPEDQPESREMVRAIFGENDVLLYPLDGLADLVREIRKTAQLIER